MMKLFVPVSFYAEYTVFDQPYGWICRRNPLSPQATLYERAKWEVSGLLWCDIADETKGLSILNNSTYGYDFSGDFVRVSLLRSACYPPRYGEEWKPSKEVTDQGKNSFTFALYPHSKGWSILETIRRAYEFAVPVLVRKEVRHEGDIKGDHLHVS